MVLAYLETTGSAYVNLDKYVEGGSISEVRGGYCARNEKYVLHPSGKPGRRHVCEKVVCVHGRDFLAMEKNEVMLLTGKDTIRCYNIKQIVSVSERHVSPFFLICRAQTSQIHKYTTHRCVNI